MRFQFNALNPTKLLLEICSKFETNGEARRTLLSYGLYYREGARKKGQFGALPEMLVEGDTELAFASATGDLVMAFLPDGVDFRIMMEGDHLIFHINEWVGDDGKGVFQDILEAFPFLRKMKPQVARPAYPEKYYELKREATNTEHIVNSGSLRTGKARFRLQDLRKQIAQLEGQYQQQKASYDEAMDFLRKIQQRMAA